MELDAPANPFGPFCGEKKGESQAKRIRPLGVTFAALLVAAMFIFQTADGQVVTAITDTGPVTYQVLSGGATVQLTIVQIANTTNGTTGTLRLELWAFPSPYSGAADIGYVMATYQLGQLTPDTEYNNVSEIVPYSSPPNGTWYVALIITEYTGAAIDNGYTPNKYVDFPNTLQIGPVAVAPSISSEPQSQTITAGNSVTFAVSASGTATLSYQWYFDGAAIPGATGASYSITSVQSGNAGTYACVVANSQGSATSTNATLTVTPAVIQPTTLKVTGPYTYAVQPGGTSVQLTVVQILNPNTGGETGTLRMELWAFPTPFTGQLENGYLLADYVLGQLNGGTEYNNVSEIVPYMPPPNGTWYLAFLVTEYTDAAVDSGYVTDTYANFPNTLVVGPTTPAPPGGGGGSASARLSNISTRAQVGTGGDILIAGFVIGGSGTETLLIRGDGPSLATFGVTGALAVPSMSVFDNTGKVISTNTGWGTNANPAAIVTAAASVGAFALPSGSADCALIATLPAGAYTVQISGVGSTTGVALAEVYEVKASGTRLINISTRTGVGTGASILISGFVISGSGSEQLLVRGDGPSLTAFGVSGVLAQPSLSVFNNASMVIASNSGWGTSANPSLIASTAASVGAFALPSGSADSAGIVNLPAGAYTVQISGVDSTTGVALAEVYEVPTP
jgi:hypothetical protein